MADVKYTQSSWEKMGRDLGNLIGSGWGKGVHEELNDVTKNLEKAEDNIATYDEDGIISFSHTDRSSQYKEIGEKLKVLKDFTGQVNTILSTEIDDPFYKEMDAYVTAVRDLDITEYSVSNSLGIKETRTAYAMGSNMTYEVKKDKINLNDILNGDNPVGKAMVDEWKNYLKNNPGAKDLSYADYQKAALYSGAFEYESISDGQKKKEFWFNMAALATTVVVGIVCPPAGFALGAALGGYEMLNAAVGKDLLSGRELGTGERWFRAGTGALGVFGGVKGLSSFSKNIRMVKGASSTKMEHVVKMMQNSGRSNYKSITSQAKNSLTSLSKQLNSIKDPGKKAEFLLEQSNKLDVSTGKNKSIFYAGRTQYYNNATGKLETVTARQMAENYADQLLKNKGVTKLTLERTPGGKWMDDLKLFEKLSDGAYTYEKYGLNEAEAKQIWSNLSSRYADGASGAVTAFTKNVPDKFKPQTIFWSTELPQLRTNPNVSHINIR
ncbi:hypothetical protein IGL98_003468 [Enterococcus sp. DIV0840]|uniref:pre-toxin TG domain-containing protein n=1 Tax=unclassified Enterococcus TaxID=2608891 RepID=UPI0030CFCE73